MLQFFLSLFAFLLVLSLLLLRRNGNLIVPMWAVFLVGSVFCLATGLVGPLQAVLSIDPQVMIFLFGMFTISKGLEISGDLESFSNWLIKKARSPFQLSLLLSVGLGLASSVIMNDSLVIMGTPILLSYSKKTGANPLPLLYTLAFAVTLGSAMTPMGNPQNMLIATESGIKAPLLQFVYYLFPFSLVSLLLLAIYMYRDIKNQHKRIDVRNLEVIKDEKLSRISRISLMAAIALMLLSDTLQLFHISTSFTLSYASLIGALLLLLLSSRRREIIVKTDWKILVMFAGLFIFTQALYSGGLVSAIYPFLNLVSGGNLVIFITLSSLLLSQVLSNVPLTALLLPLFKTLIPTGSFSAIYWSAFAASSTLAGALTLLGAASNLIVANEAERNGIRFSYVAFAKKGIPLTAICTLLLLLLVFFELHA
ncbi:MAG: SLC13 family permease [Conexivisphaerales archaeon]